MLLISEIDDDVHEACRLLHNRCSYHVNDRVGQVSAEIASLYHARGTIYIKSADNSS